MLDPTPLAVTAADTLIRYHGDKPMMKAVIGGFTTIEQLADLMVALTVEIVAVAQRRSGQRFSTGVVGIDWPELHVAPVSEDPDGVTALADTVVSYACVDDLEAVVLAIRQSPQQRRVEALLLFTDGARRSRAR